MVDLNDKTPLGLSAQELLERWEGLYQGEWEPPLGSFTLRVERDEGASAQLRTRYDYAIGTGAAGVDSDGDGVVDGAVELKLAMDFKLSAAGGALTVEAAGVEVVARSPALQGASIAFEFDDLEPALEPGLAADIGITATCGSGLFGPMWRATGEDAINLLIVSAPQASSRSQACRAYRATGVVKSPLP